MKESSYLPGRVGVAVMPGSTAVFNRTTRSMV
jgi:hypothetical protein